MKFFNILLAILLLPAFAIAQNATITGTVTNTNGNPLIGVNILLKGTNTGIVSDLDGKYTLNNLKANTDYTVQYSYTGYSDVERTLTTKLGKNILTVQMNVSPVELEMLQVSATRAGKDAPFAFTNVEKEEIQKQNLGQDVPFLLRYTPSAVVTSDAGAGIGYTGIRIRGVEPTGINVSVNGIPINDSESQAVFWVNMPDLSSSTSSIQVQRGVGTSTNGAGAFGATVNLSTAASAPIAFTELNGSFGSFGTKKGNVEFGTGMLSDKFSFTGRISNIQSDGYIDRASVDLNSYFLQGTYHGKKSLLRLVHFAGHEVTYQAWNGVPVQWINDEERRTYNPSGTKKADAPHDNEVDDYTQKHYQLLYSRSLSDNIDLSLAGHYTRGYGFYELYEKDEDFSDFNLTPIFVNDSTTISSTDLIQRRWLDNHFYGFTYNVGYRSNNDKLKMTLGGAWNTYTGDHFGEIIWARYASASEINHRYYENTGDKTDFNVYLKSNYELTKSLNAFVDLQYRTINYSLKGNDNDGKDLTQEHDYAFFNPKLGLSYALNNNMNVYASFAVANREPNRSDFTDAGDADNDDIKDIPLHETLYDTEVGVNKSWKKAAFSTNFYYMNYKNALIPTGRLNDVGSTVRVNTPKAYRAGVELIGGININKWLDFNANATLAQNKVKSFTEYVDNWDTWSQETIEHTDTDLALSPQIIQSAELVFHALPDADNQNLNLSVTQKYIGKQYLDNTSNEAASLDAYGFANLGITYTVHPTKLAKEVSLNFLVQNITNAQFSTSGWIYRFRSPSYDPIADDPYSRKENRDGQYNLTGLYPQAGTNFLVGLKIRF